MAVLPPKTVRVSSQSGASVGRGLSGTPGAWCATVDNSSLGSGTPLIVPPIDVSSSAASGFMVIVTVQVTDAGIIN